MEFGPEYPPDWTEADEAYCRIFIDEDGGLEMLVQHIRAGGSIDGLIAEEIAHMIETGQLAEPDAKPRKGRRKDLSADKRREIWAFVHVREHRTIRGSRPDIVFKAANRFKVKERQVETCFREFQADWIDGSGVLELGPFMGAALREYCANEGLDYHTELLSRGFRRKN